MAFYGEKIYGSWRLERVHEPKIKNNPSSFLLGTQYCAMQLYHALFQHLPTAEYLGCSHHINAISNSTLAVFVDIAAHSH